MGFRNILTFHVVTSSQALPAEDSQSTQEATLSEEHIWGASGTCFRPWISRLGEFLERGNAFLHLGRI